MAILAQDTFAGRTVGNGQSWGTASDGNTWNRNSANNNTILSVGSGEGKAHSGTTNNFMLLGSGTSSDQEGLVRLAMAQTGDSIGVILRSDATGANCYFAEIGDFANDIAIYKVVSGSKTNLDVQAAGFSVSNGSFYWMRFQVIGTTLKTRLWADGGSEPGTWQSNFTDATFASGRYGLFMNVADTSDVQFDSYQANDTGATPTRTITASAALQSLGLTRTISSAAALQSLGLTRTVTSSAALQSLGLTRTVTSSAALQISRTITAAASFVISRTIACSASFSGGSTTIFRYNRSKRFGYQQ
jgi:hypothetical protein